MNKNKTRLRWKEWEHSFSFSSLTKSFERMEDMLEPYQCIKYPEPVDYLKITRSVSEGDV